MHIHEDTMLLMVRERMADAERLAGLRRALRLARPPRPPVRIRLGMALVRLGHWIMGLPSPRERTQHALRQVES